MEQASQRAAAWALGMTLPDDRRFAFGDGSDDFADPSLRAESLRSYVLTGAPILTNADIAAAEVALEGDMGGGEPRYYVAITLRPEGAERFRVATSEWIKRRIAIVLDGRVDSAPIVQGQISGGHMSITLGPQKGDRAARLAEAKRLARALGGK
jgi:preprotein translocase subunit SecD